MSKKPNNLLSLKKLLEEKVHTSLNHLEEFTRGLSITVDQSRFDILSVTRVDDANCLTRRFLNKKAGSAYRKLPRKLGLFSISLGKFKLN